MFGKTRNHRCPDGSVHIVYKDVNHVYPLVATVTKLDSQVAVEVSKQIEAKIGANYASALAGALYQLDTENASLVTSLRAAYVVFQSNPCKNQEFLTKETSDLIRRQAELTELAVKLKAVASMSLHKHVDSKTLIEEFGKIAKPLGELAPAPAATFAIGAAVEDIRERLGEDPAANQ